MTDHSYENVDFREQPLGAGEYENCKFLNCDLSNADLSSVVFIECVFSGTNLSNAQLSATCFREVQFENCKMMGLHFEDCIPFLAPPQFDNCLLKLSSFVGMKLQKALFANCNLQDVDFTQANLSGALFENCDLTNGIFSETSLEKADLRTSYNYSINPDKNRIKKAKFSLEGLPGLLENFDIIID